MTVHVGTSVEQTINISNTAGDLADPNELMVILRAPDGTQTTYTYGTDSEVVRSSEGVYVFQSPALDQVTAANKMWWIAWLASGSGVTVSGEKAVEVCGLHVALA